MSWELFFAAARAQWPGVKLEEAKLVPFITERLAGDDLPAALTAAPAADLALAAACAALEPTAHAAFDTVLTEVDAAGAAVGAAAKSPATGAAVGAGAGLLGGAAIGGSNAQAAGTQVQHRYDMTYMQCMYAKGNQIPISKGSLPTTYSAPPPPPPPPPPAKVPPPPAGAPPPPPPGPSR